MNKPHIKYSPHSKSWYLYLGEWSPGDRILICTSRDINQLWANYIAFCNKQY